MLDLADSIYAYNPFQTLHVTYILLYVFHMYTGCERDGVMFLSATLLLIQAYTYVKSL